MTFKNQTFFLAFSITILLLFSCKGKKEKESPEVIPETKQEHEVKVVSSGMDFEMVDTLKSGWTTFKYINDSFEPHFIILEKMPDTLGIDAYKRDLFPPFINAFEHFEKGEMEAGMKEFEKIPEWFYRVELAGGVGLTSPKTTSKSTILLNPGTYVMECYVRMPNGLPHTFMGMVKELTVTGESNGNASPEADHSITVSSENGLTFVDFLEAGNYVFSVEFEDQKQYEHLMGHDVNLVKIENDSLKTVLNSWINTTDFNAFRTPAPEGLLFLGGVEDLPAGETGYFEVSLDKGDYVLISEVPNAIERNMIKTFSVY